jgi:hypothetical protein
VVTIHSMVSNPNHGTLANVSQPNLGGNLNFQQPFYQTMAYGPGIPLMGNGTPHGPVLEVLFPRTPGPNMTPIGFGHNGGGGAADGMQDQIAWTLHEFEFTPKEQAKAYQKPYPEYYDINPYPRGFRVPNLAKFTGDDAKSTYEHIGQFLAQVNDVGITDVHKVRLFPLSLAGIAFNWFTSLPAKSVDTWANLEQKFHEYFYNGEVELRL